MAGWRQIATPSCGRGVARSIHEREVFVNILLGTHDCCLAMAADGRGSGIRPLRGRRGWPPGRRAMKAWTRSSSDSWGAKPSARARCGAKAAGQPPTMAAIAGSGVRCTRADAPGRTRSMAASMAPTVTLMPGGLMPRSRPMGAVSMVAACSSQSTARRGLQTQTAKSSGTGRAAGSPSRGSRRMPLKKLLAALFGRPGRMTTVGRRMSTASRKPRRLASARNSSAAAFCAP